MVYAFYLWYLARQNILKVESLARPTSSGYERRHDDGRRIQLEGHSIQLFNLEIVRCYWFVRIVSLSEGSTIRSPVLAHSHRKLDVGHVSWGPVEQASYR